MYAIVFRSGWFPFGGFELEWSLVATSLEGLSVKRVPGALLKEYHCARNYYILNSPETVCCNGCCSDSTFKSGEF